MEKVEGKMVEAFQARLDELPGWNTLDSKTQNILYEESRNIFDTTQLMRYGPFWILMSLHRIEVALEGKEVRMKDYMRKAYPDVDESTIKRKMKRYQQIVSEMPSGFLEQMRNARSEVLDQFTHIMRTQPARILGAIRGVPKFEVNNEKDAVRYLEALDMKATEDRSSATKKGRLIMDRREAAIGAANAAIHYDRACSLKTSSERIGFAKMFIGWYMEKQAIPYSIHVKRTLPLPDEVGRFAGRPRLTSEEKAAARKERAKARARRKKQSK